MKFYSPHMAALGVDWVMSLLAGEGGLYCAREDIEHIWLLSTGARSSSTCDTLNFL